MVAPAERGQVALASPAPLVVGDGVVLIAAGGGPTAAGERTARLPDGDQVPQGRRRPVGGRLPRVAAIPGFQLADSDAGQPLHGTGRGEWRPEPPVSHLVLDSLP